MFKSLTPESIRQAIYEIQVKAGNAPSSPNGMEIKVAIYQTGLITIAAMLKDVKNV